MNELIFNYKFSNNLYKFNNMCILKIDNNIKKESICNSQNVSYLTNYEMVNNFFKKEKILTNQDQNKIKNKERITSIYSQKSTIILVFIRK